MKRIRMKCPGPFHDAVYDLFVRRGLTVFDIAARFQGRVSIDEIRKALVLAANYAGRMP
jgi:hypothetical protein